MSRIETNEYPPEGADAAGSDGWPPARVHRRRYAGAYGAGPGAMTGVAGASGSAAGIDTTPCTRSSIDCATQVFATRRHGCGVINLWY